MTTERNQVVTELILDGSGAIAGAAQYVRGMREAEVAANKLSDAELKAERVRKGQVGAYTGVTQSIAKLRNEYTRLQASTDPVFAAQVRHQRELERAILVTDAAVRRGVATEQQGAATVARIRQQQIDDLQKVKAATQDLVRVQRAANDNVGRANVGNIAAQFQDIGVTAAMGMSPLQIALQQGTQLQAVLGPMGAAGAVRALGSAFMSLVNPVSLVTIAVVAGTAALIQYFMASDETDEANDKLRDHAQIIGNVVQAWGDALPALQSYNTELDRRIKLDDMAKATDAYVEKQYEPVRLEMPDIESHYARIQTLLQGNADQLATVSGAYGKLSDAVDENRVPLETIQGLIDALTGSMLANSPSVGVVVARLEEFKSTVAAANDSADPARVQEYFAGLGSSMQSWWSKYSGPFLEAWEKFKGFLKEFDDLNKREGAAAPIPGVRGSDIAVQDELAASAAKAEKAQDKLTSSYDRTIERASERNAQMRLELANLGDLSAEAQTAAYAQQLMSQAVSEGTALTDAQIEKIRALAAEYVELSRAMAVAKAEQDLQFERDQIGRTDVEQRVYAQLRSLGLDINSIDGQRIADNIRINEELADQRDRAEELRDALKEGVADLLKGLFTGKDLMESLVNLGDRFATMNFDKLVDMVSSGKGFGGLFGGAPEAKAPAVEAIGKGIGAAAAPQLSAGISSGVTNSIGSRSRFASLLVEAADKVGTSARELGAVIHFESGFNPNAMNPNGKNYGLIQFGEAERQKYAVAIGSTLETQFDAIVNFLKDRGFKPGMGLLDLYSTVNAGSPGRYNAVDGATTVAQKVDMMGSHLAAADKILGGAVRDGAKAGTQEGSASGVDSAILKLGTMTQDVPSASTPQQQQNGLGKNVMSGISAALGGFSTGYQSQNAGMGALGGALQGFAATGNIFGAVVGGIAGLLGGILGARNKVKQAQRQLEKQMAQIELLLAVGEGTGIGPVQKRMTDYLAEISKVVPLAWAAEDMALVERLQQSFNTMFIRERTDFYNALPGQMEGYSSGYGRQGSKQQGAEAVFNLREELRAMIADVRYFGEKTIELTPNTPEKAEEIAALRANLERDVAAAYEAAQKMALSFISGPEELTDVQKAIAALRGAAETLVPTLIELGMSSEDAAKAIQSQVIVAMDKLRDEFSKGLTADINSATGKGYLNDITDLLEEFENVKKDAAALGVSQVEADAWFKAMAQSVVDGAQLVGSTFDDLIKAFPQLAGVVHAFVGDLEDAGTRMKDYEDRLFAATTDTSTRAGALAAFDREAARERERVRVAEASAEELVMLERVLAAERLKIMQEFADRAAERARGYQNRAFAAGNDTSTLAGQLAAFDRAAAQERIDEIKQGGEAIRDLDKALAAERLKIQRDYAKQAAEEEKRRLDEAKSFWESWTRSLKEFIDDLKAGAQSPLSPEARLAAAQTQFAEQYAKALTGDRDAANSLTSYASNVLDAGRDRWASSPEFQAIWNDMIAKLEALPNQVSAEQFIVDELTEAIEESANVQVDATAAMTDTLKAAILAGPRDAAAALALYFDDIDTSLDGLLSTSEFMAGLSGMATDATLQSIFNELDINGDLSISRLESMLAAEGLTRSTLQAAIMAGPANTASTLAQYFNKLDTSVNGLLDKAELSAAIGNLATDDQIAEMMRTLDANGDGQLSQLELIKAASQGTQTNLDSNTGVIRQVADLRAIMQEKLSGTNTLLDRQLRALNDVDRQLGGSGSFQSGGFTGFGPADQYAGRVHGREYVLDAATTARIGVDRLDAMRRGRMPMYPVPIANDNGGVATLAEMRAMRAELAAIKEELRANTNVTAEGQDRIGNATEATVKGLKAATDETRIQGNKPRSAGSRN